MAEKHRRKTASPKKRDQGERRPRREEALPEDRLFGKNPVTEAMRSGREINKAWIQQGRLERDLLPLVKELKNAGVPILEVPRSVLDQMAGGGSHQGIIVQIAAHTYAELETLIERNSADNLPPFLLLLDSINDGYNLGAILRLADTAGVSGIVIPKRRSVSLDAFVAKASAGAIEHVPVARVVNLTQTIEYLKEEGFWIVGTDASAKDAYTDIDWQGKIALIAGSEGEGISKKLLDHCDFLVSIPQFGKVNSLNVAVATGVVVFEALRQRLKSKVDE